MPLKHTLKSMAEFRKNLAKTINLKVDTDGLKLNMSRPFVIYICMKGYIYYLNRFWALRAWHGAPVRLQRKCGS